MTTWINSIIDGLTLYIYIAPASMAVLLIASLLRKRFCLAKFALDQMFLAYMLVVISLVFFPLPDANTLAEMEGHEFNLIPGRFVYDVAKDFSVGSVLQVVFNICMTIPFGMYLNYCTSLTKRETVIMTLAFSVFIEIGQLTGLFFIYDVSYRYCDIDDVIMNTLGGYLGYLAVARVETYQENTKTIPAWKLALIH